MFGNNKRIKNLEKRMEDLEFQVNNLKWDLFIYIDNEGDYSIKVTKVVQLLLKRFGLVVKYSPEYYDLVDSNKKEN